MFAIIVFLAGVTLGCLIFKIHGWWKQRDEMCFSAETLPHAIGTLSYLYVNESAILVYGRHEPVRIQVGGTDKVFVISDKTDFDDAVAWIQVQIAKTRKRIEEGKE